MKYFIARKSLREFAKHAEISLPTSFKWHYRILAVLESSQNQIILKGILKATICFLPIYKKDNAILIE